MNRLPSGRAADRIQSDGGRVSFGSFDYEKRK